MSTLKEASGHLAKAIEHHDAGRPGSARSSIKKAQACVARAIAETPDPTATATQDTGAQTSNGQQPRHITAESMATRLFRPRTRQ